MLKKYYTIFALVIILTIVAICGYNIVHNGNTHEEKQYLPINEIVKKQLVIEKLDKCHIVSLKNYDDIYYELKEPTVSEEEFQEQLKKCLDVPSIESIDDEESIKSYYDVKNMDEFYQKVKDFVIEEKWINLRLNTIDCIFDELIKRAEFELDEEQVAEFSVDTVNSHLTGAQEHGISIQEYCKNELGIEYDDFYDYCYDDSEQFVKRYLIIGAISASKKIENPDKLDNSELFEKIYYGTLKDFYSIPDGLW